MTVRLTVDRAAWGAHVREAHVAYGDALAPVVKGNGYGFGRPLLHALLVERGDTSVCVGSVHELADVPESLEPLVLTPTLTAPSSTRPVLTVGSDQHVHALAGWRGRVIVKLASSMRRFGTTPTHLTELLTTINRAGLETVGFGIHLPLAGDDAARLAEIEAWLPHLPATAELWVSHLRPESFHTLRGTHPTRRFRIRVGTALWHGIPRAEFVTLSADVLQAQPVREGEPAGYHHTPVPLTGTLLAVGAGSAHGVAALDDPDPARRSPFHFQRQRLTLLERPHMHSSLVVVADGQPCPAVGDWVDVQRPLITTAVDELVWT
jgi:alanine racemase